MINNLNLGEESCIEFLLTKQLNVSNAYIFRVDIAVKTIDRQHIQ